MKMQRGSITVICPIIIFNFLQYHPHYSCNIIALVTAPLTPDLAMDFIFQWSVNQNDLYHI